jgi:ATP-dependent Clp protease ATP-binding subunit ClpX
MREFLLKLAERMPRRKEKDNPYELKPVSIFERNFLLTLPIIRQLLFTLRFFAWVMYDTVKAIINGKEVHLWGIWCFVGLPGAGKTMSLVQYLDEQRRKYGDKIKIITNFYYAGQDEHLENYEMLLKEYDCSVIFAWDELQNEFNSREYRKFPIQLVHELTQNRKGHGKQVVYTTQTFTAVDKNFRGLTTRVVDCRTYLGRLTSTRHFRRELYQAYAETNSVERKLKIKPLKKFRFIQTDYLRSRYDSYQRLDYLKGLDYVGMTPESGE